MARQPESYRGAICAGARIGRNIGRRQASAAAERGRPGGHQQNVVADGVKTANRKTGWLISAYQPLAAHQSMLFQIKAQAGISVDMRQDGIGRHWRSWRRQLMVSMKTMTIGI